MRWIRNSDGRRDAMLTMAFISFLIVMVKVAFGGTTLNIGTLTLTIDPISPELAGVLLTTQTAGYVFRRHTDKKFGADESEPEETAAEEK